MNWPEIAREARQNSFQVAIDGPAGAGKSTVGLGLATRLGCPYVDTGLMYRAIAWLALRRGVSPDNGDALGRLAHDTSFALGPNDTLLVDGEPAGPGLRSPAVDSIVSRISSHRQVRAALAEWQRHVADQRCVVMVGRDIGTVVLPHADVKLWVTASSIERARRRLAENLAGAEGSTLDEMVGRIEGRDALDAAKPISPMIPASDAVEIDNSGMTPEQALDCAMDAVSAAVEGRRASTS